MKKYLEVVYSGLAGTSMYDRSKYIENGLYYNQDFKQLAIVTTESVFCVASPNSIKYLPIVELEVNVSSPIESILSVNGNAELLTNSMLKLVAIMKNPDLAIGLVT